MSKMIKINEGQLRRVIREAVGRVLTEDAMDNGNSIGLSSEYEEGLETLNAMAWKLKNFIMEYEIIVKAMLKTANEIGLVMNSSSIDRWFDISDAIDGHTYYFIFVFKVPNVDVNSMSDEEYEEFEKKLENMYKAMEYQIGSPSFGNIDIYVNDDGIEVNYSFNLARNN